MKIVTPEEARQAKEESLQPILNDLLVKLNNKAIEHAGRRFIYTPSSIEEQLFQAVQITFSLASWHVTSEYEEAQRNSHTVWTFVPRVNETQFGKGTPWDH